MGPLRPTVLMAVMTATVVVAASLPASMARAAGTEDSSAAEAKRHYEEGTKAFNLGEFPRAVAEFKAAYNAKPDPLLLYNIAQSYRLGGDASQALFFYKSFLRNMPDASNRKDVEAHIRRLERQLDEQKREPAAAAGASTSATVPPPVPSNPAGTPAAPAVSTPAPATQTPSVQSPSAQLPSGAVAAPATRPSYGVTPSPTQAGAPTVDLTTPMPPAQPADRPLYKKWWFWTGIAGVVVIAGSIAAASGHRGPETDLGTFRPERWTPTSM